MAQRASALTFAYKTLASKLEGPSFKPLLAVITATTLQTLTYASVALQGKDATLLNNLTTSIFKTVFQLPQMSPAQVRLEFGILNETVGRSYSSIKVWYCIKQNLLDSRLNKALWQELEKGSNSSYTRYLHNALKSTCTLDLWNKNLSFSSFKSTINKAAKLHSLVLDQSIFSQRSHSWTVLNNYKVLKPAAYLDLTFSVHLKKQLMALRFGK